MDARLVTSQHEYRVPQVRELGQPATGPSQDDEQRASAQRDVVAASLLACDSSSATLGSR
jgi:hypothetical protein